MIANKTLPRTHIIYYNLPRPEEPDVKFTIIQGRYFYYDPGSLEKKAKNKPEYTVKRIGNKQSELEFLFNGKLYYALRLPLDPTKALDPTKTFEDLRHVVKAEDINFSELYKLYKYYGFNKNISQALKEEITKFFESKELLQDFKIEHEVKKGAAAKIGPIQKS